MLQERQRAMIKLFSRQKITDLSNFKILEVGCGSGQNLLELIQFGAKPCNLVANELLDDRVTLARELLPKDVSIFPGDATRLGFDDGVFDIVYQSTVFSSILDASLQAHLAEAMWRWVRPGGGVLWYDFTFNNPQNPDVRGVPVKRMQELFPNGDVSIQRITLAPPIARAVTKVHPFLYNVFNVLPLVRTHVLCYIKKS